MVTSSSRRFFEVPPCRKATSVSNRADRCGTSIRPNSVNWVKHSTRSPSSRISPRISSSRMIFPERRPMAEPSCSSWAGWLQTCLSLAMADSTLPRRSMPSLSSIFSIMSSTTVR